MLNIIQKKGVSDPLQGRMLAYARILPGPSQATEHPGQFPWEDMVRNGILAVLGEFQSQLNLEDFLRKEFKGNIGEGIEGLAQKLRELGEDIPEDLNSEELRERLEGVSHMNIIPVPAKIVTFANEEAVLAEDADIFYMGEFRGVQHAHLAVTSFPILYQAMYREQLSRQTQSEINTLLEQVLSTTLSLPSLDRTPPHGDPVVLELKDTLTEYPGNVLELLMGQVVPNLVYNLNYPAEFKLSMQNLRKFLKPYKWPEDLRSLEEALQGLHAGDLRQNLRLELICRKIAALHHEEFEKLSAIQKALSQIQP